MILLYILIYGTLLCFVRFSGVSGSYVPLFSLFEDPTFYPNDIYVHNTITTLSTYFYHLLRIFGKLASNTYFIFFLYAIISLAHIYLIFKIAELLMSDLKKYNIGLIALLLFLYDYPIFRAISQLVNQHTFSQTVLAMPIIAASLYYYFKDKLLLSVFFIAILGIPLHLKSTWFILLVVMVYMAGSYKKILFKKVLVTSIFIFISGLILLSYRQHSDVGMFDYIKRLELSNLVIQRAPADTGILFNPWPHFINLFLVIGFGLWSVQFIKDFVHRRKLYYMYAVTGFVFIFGAIYPSFLYKVFPLPEILLLAFPRALAYPIIISLLLIAGTLIKGAVDNKSKFIQAVSILGIFFFAYFPNFKPSIFIYISCIIISYLFVYRNQRISVKMRLTPLAAWVYMSVILFLFIKTGLSTYHSYKIRSPFFPLIVYSLERDFYDCQLWAKKNTNKDAVFICLKEQNGIPYDEYSFRRFSCRPMLTGDYANFYLDYDIGKEHIRRLEFIDDLGRAVINNKTSRVNELIEKAPWKIDYIVTQKSMSLNYPVVYSNESYMCYSVDNRKGNFN